MKKEVRTNSRDLSQEIEEVSNELYTLDKKSKEHADLRRYYVDLLREERERQELSDKEFDQVYDPIMNKVVGPTAAFLIMLGLMYIGKTPNWRDIMRFLKL